MVVTPCFLFALDNGGNSPALRQLHETVKALCISVKTLSDKVSTLTNQVSAAPTPNTQGNSGALNFSTLHPLMPLASLGRALNVLGGAWLRLAARKVLTLLEVCDGRALLTHLHPLRSLAWDASPH